MKNLGNQPDMTNNHQLMQKNKRRLPRPDGSYHKQARPPSFEKWAGL